MTDNTDISTSSPSATPQNSNPWTVQRVIVLAAGAFGGIIILLFITGLLFALLSDVQATAPRIQIVRDIFIIIMSLEFIMIIGALAILILQVARLVNLLQNEVKPVLENTQEAVNNAKGTVEFVGENVAQPVVRVGSFLAGAGVFMREAGGIRRAIRRNGRGKRSESSE